MGRSFPLRTHFVRRLRPHVAAVAGGCLDERLARSHSCESCTPHSWCPCLQSQDVLRLSGPLSPPPRRGRAAGGISGSGVCPAELPRRNGRPRLGCMPQLPLFGCASAAPRLRLSPAGSAAQLLHFQLASESMSSRPSSCSVGAAVGLGAGLGLGLGAPPAVPPSCARTLSYIALRRCEKHAISPRCI